MIPTHACRAVVRGRVQGVNFRDFAHRKAVALGLVGYTRNMPDGTSVEVYAEGDEASLRALLAHLRSGPGLARVEDIEERWEAPGGGLDGFQIIW